MELKSVGKRLLLHGILRIEKVLTYSKLYIIIALLIERGDTMLGFLIISGLITTGVD